MIFIGSQPKTNQQSAYASDRIKELKCSIETFKYMHVHFNRLKKLQFHFKDRVNFKRVEVIRVKTKYVLSC